MVKTNYSGSTDLFTKRLMVSLCAPFPDLKTIAPFCSHGLVTFELKVRCQVRRLWRRVAVASVDHPYRMYGCVLFIYK